MTTTAKRILIIDDEMAIQTVVQLSLSLEAGWEVLTASSGNEGIVKAETEKPDAILLDMMMPDMDGRTTLTKLQTNSLTQTIPVIFLSAKAELSDGDRLQNLGVAGAIPKPFDSLTLASQIASILDW